MSHGAGRCSVASSWQHAAGAHAVFPIAFAPAGDRLLYLLGHSPPALVSAQIVGERLVGAHQLLADARLFAAFW
jgi:hypothetical protein